MFKQNKYSLYKEVRTSGRRSGRIEGSTQLQGKEYTLAEQEGEEQSSMVSY
jgi:hypothetical protein